MNKTKLVLAIAVLASVVAMLDGSIVNVALPAIAEQFGAGLSVQQWVVDGYLITLGALMLVAGSLADIFGRKRIMMIGLTWFGVASLLCALSFSAPFLIGARIAQGIGGALLVPSSLALIMSELPEAVRSKTIGQWTSWTSISFLGGPLLGGLLIQLASWRWIFVINVVPIALALYLLGKLETKERLEKLKLDSTGSILCVIGLGGIVYSLIEAPKYGFSNPVILASLIVGLVAMVAFYLREKMARRPLLPLGLFKIRNF
jgi:MFS family permease